MLMPKNKVKLLLNLLVIATSTIPRGGSIAAAVTGDADTARFEISAAGTHSRIPAPLPGLLAGEPEGGTLDSHAIQPYYTGLVARAAGMSVALVPVEGGVAISAAPVQTAA
jgi:histidine phosphotransferase ChpT